MIVRCPECKTSYNFDEKRIGSAGSKVRCSRCQHVFEIPGKDEFPVEDAVEEVFNQAPAFFDDQEDTDVGADIGGDTGTLLDSDEDVAKPQKTKFLFLTILLVLIVVVGVGVAAYLFAPALLEKSGSSSVSEKKVAEQQNATEKVIPEISLENVRQYFVKNEKIGQVFVVEGKAVNTFTVPKELIQLRIKLFDKAGKTIKTKEFYCGNVISYFQLQVLSLEELESALTAKVGILTNNTNLKPGADVPFMVIFPNPPETLQEFGLDAVEAKDPPAAS